MDIFSKKKRRKSLFQKLKSRPKMYNETLEINEISTQLLKNFIRKNMEDKPVLRPDGEKPVWGGAPVGKLREPRRYKAVLNAAAKVREREGNETFTDLSKRKARLRKEDVAFGSPTNSMSTSSSTSGPVQTFDPILGGKKNLLKRLKPKKIDISLDRD